METLILNLTAMAHGGSALGRDAQNRVIFVPGGIPGERVEVDVVDSKKRYAEGRLRRVLDASPDRVDPPAAGAGPHGGYAYQHIAYERQLALKREVVVDQLRRIGGLETSVRPLLPAPRPWGYDTDVALSPTGDGGFGFWSAADHQVVPAGSCLSLVEPLRELIGDFDLDLPGLRRLILRVGSDDTLLVALEVEGIEPPELTVDFPVSVAIVLPDRTAANLIGFNHIVREVAGELFQITAGCRFHGNLSALPQLVETVRKYAALRPHETAVDLYAGVGLLTRFLAEDADAVLAVEVNPDGVADAAANLEETDNVTILNDWVEGVLPSLEELAEGETADVVVMDTPEEGLSKEALQALVAYRPRRIVYSGRDIANVARDGKQLARAGYKLVEIQPLDLLPQTYHVHTVGLWQV